MKILITGGAGFQGSHLAEFLLKIGHKISILNTYSERAIFNILAIRNRINLIWGSVTDKELVEKTVRGHETVIHMAARINVDESLKYPETVILNNVSGGVNVLEAVRKYNSRLIYSSSCEVYGDGHDLKEEELLDEFSELKPNSPYAASKAAVDRICYAYFRSFNLDVTIVRPFNIYGERQKSGRFGALIPILTAKALKGENLTVFGDGSATRDYTYVSDIVRAYNLVLENSFLKGKAINFASGQNIRVKDIAEFIAKKSGVEVIYGQSRPGEVMRFPADISFARSLGYSPQINIWEGINKYLEWVSVFK